MVPCLLCKDCKDESELIKLRCSHQFCLLCMNKYLRENLSSKIKCPVGNCCQFIRDAQIRSNLSDEDVVRYETMCLSGIRKNHKCILEDCSLTVIYTDSNAQYKCPSCTIYNCICCNAAHAFTTCEKYRRMKQSERDNICKMEIERAMLILRENKSVNLRNALISLEEVDLIVNNMAFLCPLCGTIIRKGDGTKLRNCSHTFCKKCGKVNCVLCETVHSGESCEEYQRDVKHDPTLMFIEEQIKEGKLMRCPDCRTVLEKTKGCNWIQCSKCSLELCWILQIRRWGPKGNGDTSGGCKCGVNGKMCHLECVGCTPERRNATQTPAPSANSWCHIM